MLYYFPGTVGSSLNPPLLLLSVPTFCSGETFTNTTWAFRRSAEFFPGKRDKKRIHRVFVVCIPRNDLSLAWALNSSRSIRQRGMRFTHGLRLETPLFPVVGVRCEACYPTVAVAHFISLPFVFQWVDEFGFSNCVSGRTLFVRLTVMGI